MYTLGDFCWSSAASYDPPVPWSLSELSICAGTLWLTLKVSVALALSFSRASRSIGPVSGTLPEREVSCGFWAVNFVPLLKSCESELHIDKLFAEPEFEIDVGIELEEEAVWKEEELRMLESVLEVGKLERALMTAGLVAPLEDAGARLATSRPEAAEGNTSGEEGRAPPNDSSR